MHSTLMYPPQPAPQHTWNPGVPLLEAVSDDTFMLLLDAYRSSGGLARAPEVLAMCKHRPGVDVSTLARWLVKGSVISFDWQSKIWVPLFQFSRVDMGLQPGLNLVLAELGPYLSPWEMAVWFAQPHEHLAHAAPCDVLGTDPLAVLDAAWSDHCDLGAKPC
jgi:hypothetical protein